MSLDTFYEAIGNARLVLSRNDDITFQLKDLEDVFSVLKKFEQRASELEKENNRLKERYKAQTDTLNFLRGLIRIKPPSIRDFINEPLDKY